MPEIPHNQRVDKTRSAIVLTGDRNYGRAAVVEALIITYHECHFVIGDAPGLDAIALNVLEKMDKFTAEIQWSRYEADWDVYRGYAGPIRNGQMLSRAEEFPLYTCIAFHDELHLSRGTRNCSMQALQRDFTVYNVRKDGKELARVSDLFTGCMQAVRVDDGNDIEFAEGPDP